MTIADISDGYINAAEDDSDLTISGTTTGAADILGNSVRAGLADQFNELRDQLDKLADDASFNGINLLRGVLHIALARTGLTISTSGRQIQ